MTIAGAGARESACLKLKIDRACPVARSVLLSRDTFGHIDDTYPVKTVLATREERRDTGENVGTQYIFRALTVASVVRRIRSVEPVGLEDLDSNRVIDGAGRW